MQILTRLAILALWASFGAQSKVEEVQLFNHNATSGHRTLAQAAEGGDFGDVRWLLSGLGSRNVSSRLDLLTHVLVGRPAGRFSGDARSTPARHPLDTRSTPARHPPDTRPTPARQLPDIAKFTVKFRSLAPPIDDRINTRCSPSAMADLRPGRHDMILATKIRTYRQTD